MQTFAEVGVFMDDFKIMLKTMLSLEAVFNARKIKLRKTILFFLIINIGFSFPFVFSLLKMEQLSITAFIEPSDLEAVEIRSWLKDIRIEEDVLVYTGSEPYQRFEVGSHVILFDYDDSSETEEGLVARITKHYMMINPGIVLFSDYRGFERVNFSNFSNLETGDYFFKNALRGSIGQWIIPIGIVFYLIFLAMNAFFIFGMSLIAILFKFGDKVRLTYKETLSMVIYASVMPTVFTSLLTLFFNLLGLNLILYNFGTFLIYMLVRKRFLKAPKQ